MRFLFILFFTFSFSLNAQELFPHNEPASTVPKNALGIRLFGDTYDETGTRRNMAAIRLLYGITPKLTFRLTGTVTNHHSEFLPPDLITHTHTGNQVIYNTQTFQKGLQYDYRFNGINVYAKYRFLTNDGQNQHFRMSVYGEWSNVTSAHDETEPNLMDDTRGFGGGLITTFLKKHFAASLTAGIILPGDYSEVTPDFFGGELHTNIKYGKAVQYNLSFGYLIFPNKYTSYSETNINVYLEFMGKNYETAKVNQNGTDIQPATELLLSGNYVDIHPGLQFIIKSNLRIEASAGFPFINKSYARFYPIYMLAIQRYFFL
jgi:hypothetical protein